jgi:hypothetical protein
LREKHVWPPAVVAQNDWAEPLARLARDLGLSLVEAEDIANHVAAYVEAIAASLKYLNGRRCGVIIDF